MQHCQNRIQMWACELLRGHSKPAAAVWCSIDLQILWPANPCIAVMYPLFLLFKVLLLLQLLLQGG
jgi:hypothetical protein